MNVTLDPTHRDWLRLVFRYHPDTVALVKTFPNARWNAAEKFWLVPALPDVMDALIARCGAQMDSIDYDVLCACYPASKPRKTAQEWNAKRAARVQRAKYQRKAAA